MDTNTRMKCLLFFVVSFFLLVNGLQAQSEIEGQLVNHRQEPLPFASVLVLQASDSSLVKGVVTNTSGKFALGNIQAGRYIVVGTVVGFQKSSWPVEIGSQQHMDIGSLILQEQATQLNEVVVTAEKPLFEQQVDRLVVNVQNSITSSGNTVLEVLQKSPGIVVDRQNNSITMNGKSGVRVMINEKIMQLPLDVVVQMLDGMNSANVERVELITTPPARYDAEGNAGIIHIVMKENTELGTHGSFGLTAGYRAAEVFGGNFNLAHRGKKISWSLDYSVMRTHNVHVSEFERRSPEGNGFAQQIDANSHRDNVTPEHNLSAGMEWKLNKKTSLSLLLTGYRRNWEMNGTTHDLNRAAPDSTVHTIMKINEVNIWQSATASLGLRRQITSKSDLSLNADYLYYHNSNPSRYKNDIIYEQTGTNETAEIDLAKATPISIRIGTADYRYNPSGSFTLETGLKAVRSSLDNNVLAQRWKEDHWETDPVFTSYATLNEQVLAAYASVKWQPAQQYQLNAGLRYEHTHTSISTPTQKNLINRRYGYWFPSFFLRREISKESDVHFSYSRRITRPTYNDIAPFVFFWGPNTFSAGNTSLWPSLSDAIQVSYHVKQWILSLQASHARKEISFFQPEMDEASNSVIYRSQNMRYLNTVALTSSYSFAVTRWWEVQTSLMARYQVARTSHLPNNISLTIYGVNANLVNVIRLPKDFSVEVSGYYQSKSFLGVSEFLPQGSVNAGVQKKFGKGSILKVSMDDIFYNTVWRARTSMPQNNLYTYIRYDFHYQFARLTFSHSLGNLKLRAVNVKTASEEERGRISTN